MIYDPSRRALELRQRIIQTMTADEVATYAEEKAMKEDADIPVLRGFVLTKTGVEEVDSFLVDENVINWPVTFMPEKLPSEPTVYMDPQPEYVGTVYRFEHPRDGTVRVKVFVEAGRDPEAIERSDLAEIRQRYDLGYRPPPLS